MNVSSKMPCFGTGRIILQIGKIRFAFQKKIFHLTITNMNYGRRSKENPRSKRKGNYNNFNDKQSFQKTSYFKTHVKNRIKMIQRNLFRSIQSQLTFQAITTIPELTRSARSVEPKNVVWYPLFINFALNARNSFGRIIARKTSFNNLLELK